MHDARSDPTTPGKLTLTGAMRDLGFFFWLFVLIVGAPSILQIGEMIYPQFQLSRFFQWIPDGFHRATAFLGLLIEPIVQPAVNWINEQFRWSLSLHPVWRPTFTLSMVLVLGFARNLKAIGAPRITLALAMGLAALVAAISVGIFAHDESWHGQGLAAALPLFAIFSMSGLGGSPRQAIINVIAAGGIAVGAFVLGAMWSSEPSVGARAGLLILGWLILVFGVVDVLRGLRTFDLFRMRVGLTLLGGILVAGLILAADFVVQWVSTFE